MHFRSSGLVAVSGLSIIAACSGGTSTSASPPEGDNEISSSQPRASANDAPLSDITTQTHDDEAFAFDLYAQLATTPGNIFFSPYSISTALAMTWAGAAGPTADGMATTLEFSLPAARVQAARNAVDLALASRALEGSAENGTPFKLDIANAVWAQRGLVLEQPFLDTLAEDYGSGVRVEDFMTAPLTAVSDINAWVSTATDGKIPMLLAPADISKATRLVLTNAVYFNGSWGTAFDPASTQPAPFHQLDGSAPSVPMMHQVLQTVYAAGTGWQAVELPYSNPDLTLTVIIPDPGQLAAVEAQLSDTFFDAALAAEQRAEVTLTLPKFSATTAAHLAAPLTTLGMGLAFSPAADFSGIDGGRDLYISDVVHQATVTVDEAGTEAAAATAVIVNTTGAVEVPPGTPVTLTIDRPFLVVLRDRPTGAVLFVGRIVTPQ